MSANLRPGHAVRQTDHSDFCDANHHSTEKKMTHVALSVQGTEMQKKRKNHITTMTGSTATTLQQLVT